MFKRGIQRFQKPNQPRRNIQRPFLRLFKDAVVIAASFEDSHRHSVQANALIIGLGQRQIGEGAGHASVAIIKRVQGDKP